MSDKVVPIRKETMRYTYMVIDRTGFANEIMCSSVTIHDHYVAFFGSNDGLLAVVYYPARVELVWVSGEENDKEV